MEVLGELSSRNHQRQPERSKRHQKITRTGVPCGFPPEDTHSWGNVTSAENGWRARNPWLGGESVPVERLLLALWV